MKKILMSKPPGKPHKTVCISMYLDDMEFVDDLVRSLKREGFSKMNRSRLIRLAISQFDPEKLTTEDNHR